MTLLTFIVVEALPGSAAQQLLGPNATPEQVQQLVDQLTDGPMLARYVDWLGGVVTGDLGSSLSDGRAVTSSAARSASPPSSCSSRSSCRSR